MMSNNGLHRFIEVTKEGETMIFDNVYTKGISKSEYIKAIGAETKNHVIVTGSDLINNAKEVTQLK